MEVFQIYLCGIYQSGTIYDLHLECMRFIVLDPLNHYMLAHTRSMGSITTEMGSHAVLLRANHIPTVNKLQSLHSPAMAADTVLNSPFSLLPSRSLSGCAFKRTP